MAPKSTRRALESLPSITSARGAEIVGVGYEGFRSYLKRGLLGRTGMLPRFHLPGAPTFDPPTPRAGWKRFDFTDLCLMRIAKLLMDAGFSFANANAIVSQNDLWSRIAHDREPIDRYLLVWPPYGDFMLFEPDDMHHLPKRLREADASSLVVTLINLGDVERHVAERLAEV